MNLDDIREYANRDWHRVEESKRQFWIDRKQTLSPGEALAVAEGLRLHVKALRPDWPSPAERAEDLATHIRVSAGLRSVR